MAVARFASDKPAANTDTLLFTIERTALTSLVAVNVGGFTTISAWIVPGGESENPDSWIHYIDNVELSNRNTFETFRIAVNVGDEIYVRSTSGDVTFFINGIYDIAGRTNVTVGEQEPESPQIGDVWIDDSIDPKTVVYWDGTEWAPIGIEGPQGETGDDGLFVSATAPENTNVLWLDTSVEGLVQQGEQGPPGDPTLVINQQLSSYSLLLSDASKLIEILNSSATNLSIPTDANVNFPVGTQISIIQTGVGQVTVQAANSLTTTVNSSSGLKLRAQWSAATIIKRGPNLWVATGDLVP
jgi:hypothetical protein